jgi:hypothetical protein
VADSEYEPEASDEEAEEAEEEDEELEERPRSRARRGQQQPEPGSRDRAATARKALESRGVRSTSKYRGVTHHCRTGRWEAHIWETGKQVS